MGGDFNNTHKVNSHIPLGCRQRVRNSEQTGDINCDSNRIKTHKLIKKVNVEVILNAGLIVIF